MTKVIWAIKSAALWTGLSAFGFSRVSSSKAGVAVADARSRRAERWSDRKGSFAKGACCGFGTDEQGLHLGSHHTGRL